MSKLWNELVKDGEISQQVSNIGLSEGGEGGGGKEKKEEEGGEVGMAERKSPFDVHLEEWTWGQVGTLVSLIAIASLLHLYESQMDLQMMQSTT